MLPTAMGKRSKKLLHPVQKMQDSFSASSISEFNSPETIKELLCKEKDIIVITLKILEEKLDYFETSTFEWHKERGLNYEYKDREDKIVISSRNRDTLYLCSPHNKYNMLMNINKSSCCSLVLNIDN